MLWLQSLDLSILRLVRETLHNSVFDWLMPILSGNILFVPAVMVTGVLLVWKGGARGRLCVLMLALVLFVGDTFICAPLKEAIGRARPSNFDLATEYGLLMERTSSKSLPSSHAANSFAATAVAFLYYRRSLRFMLPLALGVAYSRIYKGAHYPTDVLAGAVLGAGYALAIIWLLEAVWQRIGQRWFPLWWNRLPSILNLDAAPIAVVEAEMNMEPALHAGIAPGSPLPPAPLRQAPSAASAKGAKRGESDGRRGPKSTSADQHWLRLGYLLVALLFVARLGYLASGRIELGIDEAYQWVWSKHLALSYYSKPPLIAYAQRLGTALFGDTMFGVRFLSPVSAAIVGWLLLRWLSRQGYVLAGFWLVLISAATPLLAVGATVLTVDCLLVLFWTAAMVSGWQALQQNTVRAWAWTGLWMGFGCLSKYTALFQPVCLAIFFLLSKPARIHLRRPGPYVALAIAALCTLPIWIWNSQHGWITVTHVATNARVDRPWKPSASYFLEFVVSELGLLNPIFLVAALWAGIALWRRKRDPLSQSVSSRQVIGTGGTERDFLLYLFSMGAPLFLGYALYTLHSRVMANWIAASVLPLFCLMAVYWESRYRTGLSAVKRWLGAGLSLGLVVVVFLHDTNLVAKIARRPLPPELDPLRQVRAWPETARVVEEARASLLKEGPPVFIIGAHYGLVGELSFYMAEARAAVAEHPLVYYPSSDVPANQFFFWPGYRGRKGENAIYVVETGVCGPPPEALQREFASVKDLGLREIFYRGRVFRRLQLFECRDLL